MIVPSYSPRTYHRFEVIARDVADCALRSGVIEGDDAGDCWGELAADHILKVGEIETFHDQMRRRLGKGETLSAEQRRFATAEMDSLIADARNGWLLCDRHHGLKDRRMLNPVEFVILPDHYFDFVADYWLAPVHERAFGRPLFSAS